MYRSSNRKENASEIMADESSYSDFSNKEINTNMWSYVLDRLTNTKGNSTKCFTKHLWETAKDLYKKDLTSHHGCVNAIEFSSDGHHLFSGDDHKVLMWNVNQAMMHYTRKWSDATKPSVMRACHFSNIFCLAVDSDQCRILSGSSDDQVIIHDYRTGNPVDYFAHDSPIFSLSIHPENGNIFASAADNGKVSVFDIRRSNGDPFCLAKFRAPFHGVMFNPYEPSLVATANSKYGIHIWDLRRPKEILYECSDEQSMSVRWNQYGTILLALRNLLPPVIYNPRYPNKKIEFDADSYYNACTMKSCSFAGDNDEYILSGSDDFNLYMWKVPEPWPENRWIPKAHLTLIGHRSIVNQVRYNRNNQLIASSGVEKIIKIWSPVRMPYSEGDHDRPSQKGSRFLCCSKACARSPSFLSHDYSPESGEEDLKMIHFFDSLLRNELSSNNQSQIYCVDGRLFPVSTPNHDSVFYEQLIARKKRYLLKLLTKRTDDDFPVCALNQTPVSRDALIRKYRGYLESNQALSDDSNESESESESETEVTETANVNPVTETEIPDSPISSSLSRSSSSLSSISSSTFSSPSSTVSERSLHHSSGRSTPHSSHSSIYSSSIIDSSHSESFRDLAYGNESQHSSDNISVTFSQDGSSDYGFDLSLSSASETDDSEDDGGNPNGSNNYRESGVNVSASSDSEAAAGCSSLKRKRTSKKTRSYRNSKRKRFSYSPSGLTQTQTQTEFYPQRMEEIRHFCSRYSANANRSLIGWDYNPNDSSSDLSD